METATSGAGIVRRSARAAHAFVRTQVLIGVAPFYVFRHSLAADPGGVERSEDAPCVSMQRTPVQPSPARQR